MNYYFYLKSVNKGSVENNVTLHLINHWVNCNVYTQSRKTIPQRLMVILKKYKYFREYPKNKKKVKYWNEYQKFIIACRNLFDIIGSQERRKKKTRKYMEGQNYRRRFTVLQKHVFNSTGWVV